MQSAYSTELPHLQGDASGVTDPVTLDPAIAQTIPPEIVRSVHRDDLIFQFIITHPSFPDSASAVTYYFKDGANSSRKLAALFDELDIRTDASLLEFASGYGCVTRHLKSALPSLAVTACDIHPEAVWFIRNELGTPAILSHRVPERLSLPQRYAVVFALSFYSHMPRETWGRWIRAHLSALTEAGILIFTTHGALSAPHLGNPEIPADGFWFRAQSEQRDLPVEDYGLTLVTREFVEREIDEVAGASGALNEQGFW
jgi:hypothetical protein